MWGEGVGAQRWGSHRGQLGIFGPQAAGSELTLPKSTSAWQFWDKAHTCAQAWLVRSQLWSKSCVTMVVWSCVPTGRFTAKQDAWLNCSGCLSRAETIFGSASILQKEGTEEGAFVQQHGLKIGIVGPRCSQG